MTLTLSALSLTAAVPGTPPSYPGQSPVTPGTAATPALVPPNSGYPGGAGPGSEVAPSAGTTALPTTVPSPQGPAASPTYVTAGASRLDTSWGSAGVLLLLLILAF